MSLESEESRVESPESEWISEEDAAKRLGIPILLLRCWSDIPLSLDGLDLNQQRTQLMAYYRSLPTFHDCGSLHEAIRQQVDRFLYVILESDGPKPEMSPRELEARQVLAMAELARNPERVDYDLSDLLEAVARFLIDLARRGPEHCLVP